MNVVAGTWNKPSCLYTFAVAMMVLDQEWITRNIVKQGDHVSPMRVRNVRTNAIVIPQL